MLSLIDKSNSEFAPNRPLKHSPKSTQPLGTNTPSRKQEHVELAIGRNATFERTTTGFESYVFEHNALPEIDFEDINPSTAFLGKQLSFPLMVTGMTGGYADAERINGALAEVCEQERIALGAGSQRQALENDEYLASFTILRKNAPSIPLIANIGAAEVAGMKDVSPAKKLTGMIQADALAVHLNPLQEFLQPEGNPHFKGVLEGIERLVRGLSVPVIVKEVGAGISGAVAQRLFDAGVRYIDVAGAGGTSWAGIEMMRRKNALTASPEFREWGIPTTEALIQVHDVQPADASIIASGGIIDGVCIAKALALGAGLCGAARPLLRTLELAGQQALSKQIQEWKNDLRGVLFLTGASTLTEFSAVPIFRISSTT